MTVNNLINSLIDKNSYKFIVNIGNRVLNIVSYLELTNKYGEYYINEFEVDYNKNIISINLIER